MRSSTVVRKLLVLVLLTLTASLGAGGGGSNSFDPAAASSGSVVQAAPSGLAVQPDASDPLCNGGRGIRLSAPFGHDEESAVVASATIAGGSTVIAFTAVYPGKSFAVLDSLTRRCARDREFGADGTATITIPSSVTPTHPQASGFGPDGLWVNVVAARTDGGAIIAGTFKGEWVVGEVTPHGRLDPAFGDSGWKVLPFRGAVTAVLQEPSGRIIIAGDNGGGGCCTLNWAAALSARGHFERAFGTEGRVELPTGEDSGVEGVSLEPNGDILANVGYGNMGCWGTSLAMLTPSGQPVSMFANRLGRFWQGLGLHAFVGDIYTEGDGFTLVGTGQQPCYESASSSAASPTGLLARFDANGEPTGQTVRFPSEMYGSVEAFHVGEDTFLVEAPYADGAELTLTARRADGSIDPSFGRDGRVLIRAPSQGRKAILTNVSIDQAGPNVIAVVVTRPGSLEVIRVDL
jgi:hypothetical protein